MSAGGRGSAQRHRDATQRRHACRHAGRAAGRRRVRRRPQRQRPAGSHRRAAGFRGRAVRAHGHAEQPVRHLGPLPARRRVPRRPDGTLLPLGRWRCGGHGQRAAAADRPSGRRRAGAGRHRGRHQARRRAFRPHPAAGAGEHAGRQAAAVRLPAGRNRPGRTAWPGAASGRCAPVQRGRGAGRTVGAARPPRRRAAPGGAAPRG